MPQIKCHNCGRTRLVTIGKRKNCRGCGTKLTDIQQPMNKSLIDETEKEVEITVAELAKQYPHQVTEIVAAARADIAAEEFGGMNADDVEKTFPEAVVEIVNKATAEFKDLKPDELQKVFPDAVKKLIAAAKADGKNSILKLSINKIAKIREKQKAKSKKG